MQRKTVFITFIIVLLIAVGLFLARDSIRSALFNVTGEDQPLSQLRALIDLASNFTRPMPNTADNVPVDEAGVNPFGVNTFLQQEVEPAKRDRQLQMLTDAGFKWIRQQFPWADIEIGGKGNFQDCRNGPCIDAWAKYDNIVDLAQQHNIDIIARLDAPPKWAQSTPGDFAPPTNFDDYGDYVAAVAERYKGRVKYYQIWNEPNNYSEWGEQPVNPEDFTKLLCTA